MYYFMNKKFFTLAAGLLLSSAWASAAGTTLTAAALQKIGAAASPATATSFVSGNTYIIVADADAGNDIDNTEILLGQTKTGTTLTQANAALNTLSAISNQFRWEVTETKAPDGKCYYQFKNVGTGAYLTVDKDGNIVDKESDAVDKKTDDVENTTYFFFGDQIPYSGDASAVAKTTNGSSSNKELKIVTGNGTTVESTGGSQLLFAQEAAHTLLASELNALQGNGFALNFPEADPAPSSNPFGSKLVAVYVGDDSVDEWNTDGEDTPSEVVEPGLYFVSSLASEALDNNGKFKSLKKFRDSKFVAVSPLANYGLTGMAPEDGDGYKFTTVSGGDMVLLADAAKKKTPFNNAIFTVTEANPMNGKGVYTITVTPAVASGDDVDESDAEVLGEAVTIAAVTSAGTTYLTTLSDDALTSLAKNASTVAKASSTNVVEAKDFLSSSAPSLFNIQFTSGKADLEKENSSEYGKYLGLTVNAGDYAMLAQGSAFVDLDAPQNQWIVTAYSNGFFTFTNREDNDTKVQLELRKTSKANVYDVRSAEEAGFAYAFLNDKGEYNEIGNVKDFASGEIQVKLVPATLTPNAGYADLTKEEMAEPIRIKFTTNNSLLVEDLYVTTYKVGDDRVIDVTDDADEATLWEITKLANKVDSISSKIKYIIYKNKAVEESEEIVNTAITTYILKEKGEDAYFNGANNLELTDDADEAPRQIIKVLKNGAMLMFAANVGGNENAYADNVDAETTALSLVATANLIELADDQLSIYDNVQIGEAQMSFESVAQTSVSLEGLARHASFPAVNGGFLAVGAEGDAVIAATKDEAEELTFWLDTVDVKDLKASFYISKGIPAETKAAAAEPRNYLFNATDSTFYYDEETASKFKDYDYYLSDKATVKAIFKAATMISADSLNTVVDGKEVGLNAKSNLDRFQFRIVKNEDAEDEYLISSVADGKYLTNINGKVGFGDKKNALVVNVSEGIAPTANEAIEAAGVQVIGGKGAVTVQGAAGKVITIANVLGQTIANQVAASDNVTIAAPAGIVVVAVEGEATKVVVK